MHIKTMEGLVGAGTNFHMLEVPMRIYRQAERQGDLATMERAGEYVTEFAGRKDAYREEAEEGMELERLEKKKEKKEQEERVQKEEKARRDPEEAASLEISPEGKAAWQQAAGYDGKEETENENRRNITVYTDAGNPSGQ